MKYNFTQLYAGNIAGCVDSYGAVHSIFSEDHIACHTPEMKMHQCLWRWNYDNSICWMFPERRPTPEQYDAIERHIEREYGIKFWENGHHDLDYFGEMLKKEKNT